jgi:hypothetical protein
MTYGDSGIEDIIENLNKGNNMKTFLNSLLSRKLWLAVAAFITFTVNGAYTEAIGVVVAYFASNGVDAFNGR